MTYINYEFFLVDFVDFNNDSIEVNFIFISFHGVDDGSNEIIEKRILRNEIIGRGTEVEFSSL